MLGLLTFYAAATFLGSLGGGNTPKNVNNNNSNNNSDSSTETSTDQQQGTESDKPLATQGPLLSVATTGTTSTTTSTSLPSTQDIEQEPATLDAHSS